jgi:flagellar biosynthesis/type III secretory pathway M-ring protein FliF/YscJ
VIITDIIIFVVIIIIIIVVIIIIKRSQTAEKTWYSNLTTPRRTKEFLAGSCEHGNES